MQNTPRQLVSTYGCILNSKQQMLLVQRALHDTYPGLWEMPGGGVEWGEDPKDAVVREIEEEAGLMIEAVKPLAIKSSMSPKGNHVIRIAYLCKLIKPDQEVTLSEEHSAFQWVSLDTLPDLYLSSLAKRIFVEKEKLKLFEE